MSLQSLTEVPQSRRLREQADELKRKAAESHSVDVRVSYLELARRWQDIADRLESGNDTLN